MTLIAITGGIGAGKTTLTGQFKSLGASVADADDIAHGAYLPGNQAYFAMLGRWGEKILDVEKKIDRKAVASIVFNDQSELQWLNGIIHPFVQSTIADLAAGTLLFCAIPLLYESGRQWNCGSVIAAWCPPAVQRERLRLRGWSELEIERRLKSQISMDEKLRRADYGIITSCSWKCLRSQCERVYESIMGKLR